MTSEAALQEISHRLHSLRVGYLAHTADDVDATLALLDIHQNELPATLLAELHLRFHRIAGTAGSFGYTELGARARLMELRVLPDGQSPDPASLRDSLGALRQLVQSLLQQADTPPIFAAKSAAAASIIEGSTGLRLLIGGDDPNYCQLLATLLGNSFDVDVSHTGAEVLEHYTARDADIVLLDVGLPDMTGYDVCRQLDLVRPREWRSVVFVSVNSGIEDKLSAYDAGGDDFIAKPIQLDELLAKLKTLATYTQSKKNLLSQNQFAQKLAFDSMAEVAQYGRLVDFMRLAMGCCDHDSLANAFFECMDALGLNAALRFGGGKIVCLAGPNQACSPIESNLLEIFAGKDRLQHLGKRTLVNGRHISFLVKNMPVDDEIAYGRLKDLVAVMVEALDACYMAVARQQALRAGVTDVGGVLRRLAEGVLAEGGSMQVAMRRLEHLMRDLENGFHFLDLNEEQERYLYGLLSQGAQDSVEIVQTLTALREDLSEINRNLTRYAN